MNEFRIHGVYIKVPLKECWDTTGQGPIGTKWIVIDKGDKLHPEYRSRLVAQEINMDKRSDLFAGTPPIEALRCLLAAAAYDYGMGIKDVKLVFYNVRRAYFHAEARREVFVKLAEEDQAEGMCGKLIKAMYSTRDAAQDWERKCNEVLIQMGFACGVSKPCVLATKATHSCSSAWR